MRAGADVPRDRIYDGFDLGPMLRGESPSPRSEFFYFLGRELQAVRQGSWKYRKAAAQGAAATPELFHLDRDPAEQYNVYEIHREIGERLAERMTEFQRELGGN